MAHAATFDAPSSPALAAPGRAERERAFAAARRHSRLVRLLRKAIPLAIVGWVLWAFFGRLLIPLTTTPIPDVAVSTIGIQGSKLTMEQPKLSGFKKDNKGYEVVAEAATQDIKNPSIVELTKPVARIETQKGSWVRLSAGSGVYDSTTQKLVVSRDVNVKADNGLDMRMSEANVDFKTGGVVSNAPVAVDMPDGWVKASRMNVTDNGKTILFEGEVKSQFTAIQPKPDGAEEKPAP
jgi:lipopolysaccharide export system protein LptC